MTLSFKDVAEILKLIDASQCDEVMLELEGVKLQVRRSGAGSSSALPVDVVAAGEGTEPAMPAAKASASAATPAKSVTGNSALEVRAPMVGTFYRCPSPGQPPFVEKGATVSAGDPLCLIEVMKLYTTIEAESDGVVESIGAEDGQLVEFDQLLFAIKPL